MKKTWRFVIRSFLLAATLLAAFSSCMVLPVINHSQSMKDITANTLSVAVATDFSLIQQSTTTFLPDQLSIYLGFAPCDWFEFALYSHYLWAYIALEAKFDPLDIFLDNFPLSLNIVADIGLITIGGGALLIEAGAYLNFHPLRELQIAAGVGINMLAQTPVLEASVYFQPWDWLGIAATLHLPFQGQNIGDAILSLSPSLQFAL